DWNKPRRTDERSLFASLGHQPYVSEVCRSSHENDIGRLDIAVNQTVLMHVLEGSRQCEPDIKALLERQASTSVKLTLQRARLIIGRLNSLPLLEVIRQFHDVIKIGTGVIAADLQDVHQPFVRTRDRLEIAN